MKKLNKKGFTIVELVIVIAVIAILAAVMIPTFSGIIEKANQSAALQEADAAYTEDLIALDGQASNYNTEAYKDYTYTKATGTYDANGVYYTLNATTSKYDKVTTNVEDDFDTYYVQSDAKSSITKGTFTKEADGSYKYTYTTADGKYEAKFTNGKWTVEES